MSETKFYTHTEPHAKLQFFYPTCRVYRQRTRRQKVLTTSVTEVSCMCLSLLLDLRSDSVALKCVTSRGIMFLASKYAIRISCRPSIYVDFLSLPGTFLVKRFKCDTTFSAQTLTCPTLTTVFSYCRTARALLGLSLRKLGLDVCVLSFDLVRFSCFCVYLLYCDLTPESRNSSLLGNGSVKGFPRK
jgi:hypothetical protein